jgi:hypothetical protein
MRYFGASSEGKASRRQCHGDMVFDRLADFRKRMSLLMDRQQNVERRLARSASTKMT